MFDFRSPFAGACSLEQVASAQPAFRSTQQVKGLLTLLRMASPLSPYPTAKISRRENPRLRRREASRMSVSAWDARRRPPKAPRNGGDFSGCARARAGSLCNSRLVGGGSSPARTRLSAPNSLIYGKIQGICANSGSPGLAIGPDSLACTRTCAARSLEPGTGNFVPWSRDSLGHDLPLKLSDAKPAGIRIRGLESPSRRKRGRLSGLL